MTLFASLGGCHAGIRPRANGKGETKIDNSKAVVPESRESGEQAGNPQRQKMDDATFEPRSRIEQVGEYKQSEAIQNAFGGVMENLRAREQLAKDSARRPPGEINRPRPESIAPASSPNSAGSSEGAVRGAGVNPGGEGKGPGSRPEAPGPAGESNQNPKQAGQIPESGDLTSEKQLKLQQMMKQKTQIEQTLSNGEKKFENTQEELIDNLK